MTVHVTVPTFEHHAEGRLGVGEARPRLSWRVEDAPADYRQLAAQVEVTVTAPDGAVERSVHDLPGPDQVLVPWPARALGSREAVAARVRVRHPGGWSSWSEPGHTEVGLLDPAEWQAEFVGPDGAGPAGGAPGRVRTEFTVPGPVRRARLYVSAHGLAEIEINGRRVGDEELSPGWTSYRHRLRYATFDVTDQLTPGPNAVGAWLGDGWWRGRIGFGGSKTDVYGEHLAVLVQLEIVTDDGARHTVVTDSGWLGGPGPIVSSGLYDGERFDARAHDPAWSTAGFDTTGWTPVVAHPWPLDTLVAPTGPPVRCTAELAPVSVTDKGEGRWLLDFGQNHSGRLRLRGSGRAGGTVTVRHAEVLQDGELCTEPLRTAEATDVLVTADGPFEWEPRFTVHGYRYAEIAGWTGPLRPGDVVSRVLHTDLERTGWFRSSDALVSRLHENVVWSLRSNFVDLPTDCPQRDERLGWTGDLQVFAPTAAFLYDVTGMLASWLQDLAAEQEELDWVPPYVPYVPLEPFTSLPQDPMALWGDVAVLTPDALHRSSADAALLRRQLPSATAWLRSVEDAAGPERICHDTEQLGDWLDPAAPPESPFEATTDRYLVATAYYAHSARRLAAIARTLGEEETARRYDDLAGEVREAFARRYLLPDGRCTSDTQAAYALITVFDLWPDEASRRNGTARLVRLVREAGGRIATGFAGTPVVCDALTLGGHTEEAYLLLQATECPSWLYTVRMGGTTTWERWDSLRPDGSVNSPSMTSFNHYALGAVADWMHRVVAGIAPAAPGYRHIRFAPRPGGTLTSAGATHVTPYGPAAIDWSLTSGTLDVTVVVPPGATATVDLPGVDPVAVGHGTHRFAVPTQHPSPEEHDARP